MEDGAHVATRICVEDEERWKRSISGGPVSAVSSLVLDRDDRPNL